MTETKTVTIIPGDGIGPEVVQAAMRVMDSAGAGLEWELCEAGAAVFAKGIASGVPEETLQSIARNRIVLKGPLETPIGYGGKSANVTLRKLFETYGNIRPVRELPGIQTPFTGRNIDLVVVRENVEDLYAGIEHMQTPGVAQCLKLTSTKGCDKIVRLAFELARAEGRKSVHCCTKANIMKMTEGLLKQSFEAIAPEYPDIAAHQILVDNCAHQLVRKPEQFEVIVTTNMNGDILSDLTSGLVGGLGIAPSANIGSQVAMFEAVHGSAPDIAGKNCANPVALLLSSVLMLRHLGKFDAAFAIKHALLCTLEQGCLTGDLASGKSPASTTEFTDAVVANLGKHSENYSVRNWKAISLPPESPDPVATRAASRKLAGVDIFLESGLDTVSLGQSLDAICADTPLRLKMISNRGTKVYPPSGAMTDCVDHWRCRFVFRDHASPSEEALQNLLARVSEKHYWMHLEKLQEFDGRPAFAKAQGED